jgi:hypothetical protein
LYLILYFESHGVEYNEPYFFPDTLPTLLTREDKEIKFLETADLYNDWSWWDTLQGQQGLEKDLRSFGPFGEISFIVVFDFLPYSYCIFGGLFPLLSSNFVADCNYFCVSTLRLWHGSV